MKNYKGIIGFFRMKYEQWLIRQIDKHDLGFIWSDCGTWTEDQFNNFCEFIHKED